MRILVTGGAGFIGSALVRHVVGDRAAAVLTVDKLTYAGRLENLAPAMSDTRHRFERADIADEVTMRRLFAEFSPDLVFHLAAETHVDRSIDGAGAFIRTNVQGTHALLEAGLAHWRALPAERAERFRFVHVSTDEVYGTLPPGEKFSEASPYRPNSPYAASKAAADFLVRAWHETHGFPGIITNCTNNYGPYQYPEKLVPLVVLNAAEGRMLPVYGDGLQMRDWLYVEDHVEALLAVAERGRPGATYCIGGDADTTNLDLVRRICAVLDELRPAGMPHAGLIRHVADRPGHDRRYAMDISRITAELGWRPRTSLNGGLRATISWYLENAWWRRAIAEGDGARRRRGLPIHSAAGAA